MTQSDERRARTARTAAALAASLLVAGLFWSVADIQRSEREVGTPGRPVVFVLSPDHGRRLAESDRHLLEAALERESGLRVEIQVAATPLDAIEAFGGRADAGILGLFEYLLARREYGVEAGLRVRRAGGGNGYVGAILVRADDPAKTLRDLAGRRMAYVDPHSTSGFVFPAQRIAKAGVRVVPTFAGSHEAALARVQAGAADAAAVYANLAREAKDVRVLDRTETIPFEPVIFRTGLRADQRERIARALELVAEDPRSASTLALVADITGFVRAGDTTYESALSAVHAAGSSIYEVVPEGLRVESRRRGIEYVP